MSEDERPALSISYALLPVRQSDRSGGMERGRGWLQIEPERLGPRCRKPYVLFCVMHPTVVAAKAAKIDYQGGEFQLLKRKKKWTGNEALWVFLGFRRKRKEDVLVRSGVANQRAKRKGSEWANSSEGPKIFLAQSTGLCGFYVDSFERTTIMM